MDTMAKKEEQEKFMNDMVNMDYMHQYCYGLKDSNLKQPDVVSRKDWGAGQAEGFLDLLQRPVSNVVVTYAPLKPAEDKFAQSKHVTFLQNMFIWQGFYDIPYSFLVFPDGDIYEGRGWVWVADYPFGRRDLFNTSILIARITKHPDTLPDIIKTTTDESIKKIIDYGLLNEYVKEDYKRLDVDPWHVLS